MKIIQRSKIKFDFSSIIHRFQLKLEWQRENRAENLKPQNKLRRIDSSFARRPKLYMLNHVSKIFIPRFLPDSVSIFFF